MTTIYCQELTRTIQWTHLKKINSIDDILNDDLIDVFDTDDAGLFEFKHTPKAKKTTMPDYVARRRPCEAFDMFEPLLVQCQKDLASGKRQVVPFKNEQEIDQGYFFVLSGVLLFIAEIGERTLDKKGKKNARLRCVFENGTESRMLLRSLSAELYKNGRRVTEHQDKLLDGLKGISQDDIESGHIYVLRSKSTDHRVTGISNLHKIGYSSKSVNERIKNAPNEPTYLMAEVEYICGWKCYNMNVQRFENLMHRFFSKVCLEIEVTDNEGIAHMPREWFDVPLTQIERAIQLLISGEIVNFRYNEAIKQIESI